MQRLYLDMSHISDVPNAYRRDSGGIAALSGYNLGNYAFRHALKFLVGDLWSYRPVDYTQFNKAIAEEKPERILISAANWLGTSEDDEKNNAYRTNVILAADAPVVVFGLGVQAKAGAGIPQLGRKTARMAAVLAERCAKLSVRDQITHDTLESIGVRNSVVTGCPSNFINGDPGLGARVAERARLLLTSGIGWGQVRSVISEYSPGHATSDAVLSANLRLFAESPAFNVIQTPELLPLLFNETRDIPGPYLDQSPYPGNVEALRSLLRAKTLHFNSIDGWMDFARTCDLSFGMRIHGNMVPLQAGVPSILISHDSRTAGLANFMGIPSVTPEEFVGSQAAGPGPLFDQIAQVMDGYDARRQALAQIMRDFVVANGLPVHDSLQGLAA